MQGILFDSVAPEDAMLLPVRYLVTRNIRKPKFAIQYVCPLTAGSDLWLEPFLALNPCG
jgi:hypothetical protein